MRRLVLFLLTVILTAAIGFAGDPPKSDPPNPCIVIDPLIPNCVDGCYTPRVCAQETGFTETECKDCIAIYEPCVFFGRETGFCKP